ncbi:MAG: hypothetical protein IV092_02885 [Burkholderiaceae bacterium]|nr:hypothetical protein [Burkholderiaceae bacterium]
MHLLIPFTSALGDNATHTLKDLALPRLARALRLLTPEEPLLGSDEYSLTPPHERALAQAWGWSGADGCLPFAARHAQADGIATGELCWAELTPLHLLVGSDQISALDTATLSLDPSTSRGLFESLAELFPASEGWASAWGAPLRWYVGHESLRGLPCASLDRVMGRGVDPWMPEPRRLRTLQNEVQMLLHNHPLNDAREAKGLLPINSVWISGCGPAQAVQADADLQTDWRLRAPLLAGDWAAWAEAWALLDSGPVQDLLRAAEQRQDVRLTLCGERQARSWALQPRPWWKRLWNPPVVTAPVLEGL